LRILRLLEGNELHVNELVEVLELPQPTVSRHLGVLLKSSLLRRRREGIWTFYSLDPDAEVLAGNGLGVALRARLRDQQDHRRDAERLQRCLEARVHRSREFYARVAAEWDTLRAGLDVEGLHAHVLGELLPGTLDLVDAGTGTGALLPVLAPAARRLVGIDRSPEMLDEARRRLVAQPLAPVVLVRADLGALPFADASVDGVCSLLALHHVARPPAVVVELARIVRPGGAVVVSDLAQHDEEWMRSELAHAWLGFPAERLAAWFADAGLEDVTVARARRRRVAGARPMPDLLRVRGRRPRAA
jgi:ArsR family transcriptional regulator